MNKGEQRFVLIKTASVAYGGGFFMYLIASLNISLAF